MRTAPPLHPEVIWHDLECGAYRADLELWRELAGKARPGGGARVLDIGAGTGRVALELAREGHRLTALDHSPQLLGALRARTAQLPLETILADARDFAVAPPPYDLCLVPMQTLQLLRGRDERGGLLRCARAALRPGALLACAIVTDVEPFDASIEGLAPAPERLRLHGITYESQAVRVSVHANAIRIERDRRAGPHEGLGEIAPERDQIELERISEQQLWDEGEAAGLAPARSMRIAETEDHVGSLVVMLRA